MPLPQTASLPQLPAPPEGFQPKTAGQLRFEESQPRILQAEAAKQNAIRQAQRTQRRDEIGDKLEDMKAIDNDPSLSDEEKERRYAILGVKRPGGSGVAGAFVTGNGTRGKDLIEIMKRQGAKSEVLETIDPNKLYTLVTGHDKATITNFYPKEESAIGTGKEASGAQVLAMGFTTDKGGAPVQPGGTYTILHSAQGGAPIGVIPTAQLATYAQQHKVNFSVTNDGIVETPYTESTTTQKGLPNTAVGGAVPAQLPEGSPKPVGSAAKSATPSTPLPSPSFGTETRPSPGRPAPPNPYTDTLKPGTIIGQKPLTAGEFTAVNNAKQGLRALDTLRKKIEDNPNVLLRAAIPGSPGARLFATWKNELSDIITRLRTGAALNEEEQHFYQSQMPGLMDLLGQKIEPGLIEDKLKIYDGLFNGVITQYGRRTASGFSPEAIRSTTVTLMAPDGEVRDFPLEQAGRLIKSGAKIVGK